MSIGLEDRVRAFVARETAVKPDRLSMDTTFFGDLGVDGADGWELIESFGREFSVDLTRFDPGRHFGPEAGWMFPVSLVYYFRTLTQDPHDAAAVVPISIRDLVEAAKQGRWMR
jgi:acyl carrier protein